MINREDLEKMMSLTDDDVAIAKEMSGRVVNKYTTDLDNLMLDINRDIITANDVPDMVLERYLMELANAYFFISSKCESAGLYEDIAKSTAKMKYNDAYSNVQIAEGSKKPTISELTIAAENASLNETLVANIYSRSFKIIKAKLEAANTMISTLSKILNSHDISKRLSSTGV